MKVQFRLRTLMIAVTLLAVPLGYVGWQAKIVRERKAVAADVVSRGGEVDWTANVRFTVDIPKKNGQTIKWPYPQVSWIRRLLGDDYALFVIPRGLSDEELTRVKAVFPEAEFIKHYADP